MLVLPRIAQILGQIALADQDDTDALDLFQHARQVGDGALFLAHDHDQDFAVGVQRPGIRLFVILLIGQTPVARRGSGGVAALAGGVGQKVQESTARPQLGIVMQAADADAMIAAHDRLEAELERHLAAARDQQDRLGELMRADPAAGQATWPLRGELISQLDRLRYELGESKPGRTSRRRRRSWRRLRPARLRPPRRRLSR